MDKFFNRTCICLILIVLLAGAIRIGRACQEKRYSLDAYHYFQMSEKWAYHGAEYAYLQDPTIPPLLLFTMAIAYNIGLTPEQTGLIIGIVLGMLMPLVTFWIALNLYDSNSPPTTNKSDGLFDNKKLALIAALFMAVNPFFARISVSCIREILYFPIVLLAIGFAASAIKHKSLGKWCGFAALTALAAMTRHEGICIILIFCIWVVIELLRNRKTIRKSIIHYAAASILVLVIYSGLVLSAQWMLRKTPCTWNGFGNIELRFELLKSLRKN